MPRETTKEEREALLREVEFVRENVDGRASPVCQLSRAVAPCDSCLYASWLRERCAKRYQGFHEHSRRIAQAKKLVQMAGLKNPEKPKRFKFNEGGWKRVFIMWNNHLRISFNGRYMTPYTGQRHREACHILDTQDHIDTFARLAATYTEPRNAKTR